MPNSSRRAVRSFRTISITLVTTCLLLPSPLGLRAQSAADALPHGVALATFDTVWTKVRDTYVDTAFVATRWQVVRDSLRPRASGITSRRELDQLIAATLKNIPDSHFYIIPASAVDENSSGRSDGKGTTGLFIRIVGPRALAWRVEAGSPAAAAGIKTGDVIVRTGDRDVARSIRRVQSLPAAGRPRALSELLYSLNGAVSPPVGDTAWLEIASKGSKARRVALVAIPTRGRVSQFGNLPPIAANVRVTRVPLAGSTCVGLIAFNIWLPDLASDLAHAVDSVRSCAGAVIDLRANPGGLGAMVMGFGGYFVDSTISLGAMRTRQVTLNFVINPRRSRDDGTLTSPYTGPVAILVDPMTASTSEIFATGMQRIGRARVFGERSAGAALPALMERLPSGDVFVHAVADFTDPAGRRIEGSGVVPDQIIPLTEKDVSAGRDAALEAAMRWIKKESAVRPAASH